MADFLIVVNGIPGAGKTTLAAPLARELGVTLVAKDALKEALADAVDAPLPTSRIGAVATDALWAIAGMLDGVVMIESFWASGRDERWFRRGHESIGAPAGIELWCDVPRDVARQRARDRPRHKAHADAGRREEWEVLTEGAAPISGLPTLRVDTSAPVDLAQLIQDIRKSLPV
ncbi:AAA family ATPase [Microbacterium paludicola]|uniref:AAA family ATPase n=1 Tax=Microbacterium paludicola TaxID=300019 RepID=UPI0014322300|nr:AAA family ATPase [Microbacterium paludicola]MBF0816517.1 AAA family ATPase [Microbacterium paludicola]